MKELDFLYYQLLNEQLKKEWNSSENDVWDDISLCCD